MDIMYFELKKYWSQNSKSYCYQEYKDKTLSHVAIHNFNFFLSEDCFLLHLDAEGY